MPRIETTIDAETELAFRALAKRSYMTRTSLLRRMIKKMLQRNPVALDDPELSAKRSERINVRVSAALYSALSVAASQTESSRPGVVLAVLRARFLGKPTLLRSEAEALARTAFELSKVGTNLNQLVRQMHQGKLELDPVSEVVLSETLLVVSELRKQISHLIESATYRWRDTDESA
jgi:uncharacterized protein (DUF1778 family)